jgi:hypothetical protein
MPIINSRVSSSATSAGNNMPIIIYPEDHSVDEIATLCDGVWSLTKQLDALQQWLSRNKNMLNGNKMIADIGFSLREDAAQGGAVLAADRMKQFADNNIDIYFSEYRDE